MIVTPRFISWSRRSFARASSPPNESTEKNTTSSRVGLFAVPVEPSSIAPVRMPRPCSCDFSASHHMTRPFSALTWASASSMSLSSTLVLNVAERSALGPCFVVKLRMAEPLVE